MEKYLFIKDAGKGHTFLVLVFGLLVGRTKVDGRSHFLCRVHPQEVSTSISVGHPALGLARECYFPRLFRLSSRSL